FASLSMIFVLIIWWTSRSTLFPYTTLFRSMELLEQGLAEAREPRERFYWRLAGARLLKETGLKAMAGEHLQDLKNQIQGLVLEDWEPGLIKQLERLA